MKIFIQLALFLSTFLTVVYSQDCFKKIIACSNHNIALREDGTLWAWEKNAEGLLGFGETSSSVNSPRQIGTEDDWLDIEGNSSGTLSDKATFLALKNDSSLWGWGYNYDYLLSLGHNDIVMSPTLISNDKFIKIAVGNRHIVVIKKDGSLWACGNNNRGQLGIGNTTNIHNLQRIGSSNNWIDVFSGRFSCIGVQKNSLGTYDTYTWGWNIYGQLGLGDNSNRNIPTKIDFLSNIDEYYFSNQGNFVLAVIKKNNQYHLYSYGRNNYGQLGTGDKINLNLVDNNALRLSSSTPILPFAGVHNSFFIHEGKIFATGLNQSGNLGIGNTDSTTVYTQVGSEADWKRLRIGSYHAFGTKNDGTLWVWGNNASGRFGNGNITGTRHSPLLVSCNWLNIENVEILSFELFPNPVENVFVINSTLKTTAALYSSNGNLIKEFNITIGNNVINIENLEIGVYFVAIGSQIMKLVKK